MIVITANDIKSCLGTLNESVDEYNDTYYCSIGKRLHRKLVKRNIYD